MSRKRKMIRFSFPRSLAPLTALILLVSLCAGSLLTRNTEAQSNGRHAPVSDSPTARKVSPDLVDRVHATRSADKTVSVILKLNGRPTGRLNAFLNRNGVHVNAHFENFDSMAVELPASA